ncbi:MAG: rRNA maturation RNase YbeY [Pyrinomonadaceae bacterium]
MIEIVNQQRKIKIDSARWREFAEKAIASVKEAKGKTATIAFVSDKKMRQLNHDFRSKNTTTDVLSFPFEADEFDYEENCTTLGDIVISVEQARRQAEENNLPLELEISQLILHGILHLCGYNHETDHGKMNTLELKLRGRLGIA